MYKLSYLITFRQFGEGRLQNLLYVLQHLSANDSIQVVLVEQDEQRHLPEIDLINQCDYVFVRNHSSFNKSWGLNVAAQYAKSDRLLMADADMVIPHGTILKIIDEFNHGSDAINPYLELVDLSQAHTTAVLAGNKSFQETHYEMDVNRETIGHNLPFCGGIFAISAQLFAGIGGMDERFSGWGGEDNAVTLKVQRSAKKMVTLESEIAYHLWHQKSHMDSNNSKDYVRNLALLSMYYEHYNNLVPEIAKADEVRNGDQNKYVLQQACPIDDKVFSNSKLEPLISCVCVTRDRVGLLKESIDCFFKQSYSSKELVVVCEENDSATVDYLLNLDNSQISPIVVAAEPKKSLGELRNISIAEAKGEYVCQWDDDDWYHPRRLEIQLQIAQKQDKAATVLPRWLVYVPASREAYCSNARLWEGSLLCKKSIFNEIQYPSMARGEDSDVIKQLFIRDELAVEDYPDLYVYYYRGSNTWNEEHFKNILDSSTKLEADDLVRLENMLGLH